MDVFREEDSNEGFKEKKYIANSQNDQRLKMAWVLVSLTNLLLPHAPLQVHSLYFFSAHTNFGGHSRSLQQRMFI